MLSSFCASFSCNFMPQRGCSALQSLESQLKKPNLVSYWENFNYLLAEFQLVLSVSKTS